MRPRPQGLGLHLQFSFGPADRDRTCDAQVFSLPLYQLSYHGRTVVTLARGRSASELRKALERINLVGTQAKLRGGCDGIRTRAYLIHSQAFSHRTPHPMRDMVGLVDDDPFFDVRELHVHDEPSSEYY